MEVVIVRRLAKLGDKHCFTVPNYFIESGILQRGKLYILHIREVKQHELSEDEGPRDSA